MPAAAQTTTTYSNTTTGTINNGTTCSAPLVRNFTVATSYTVGDVDLGVLAAHSWRGDLRITLQSPAGTRVQLVNGDTNNISGDNFNVRLNDSGTQLVNTDGNTVNHATTAPYQHNFSPNSALSAFAGQNSAGTWRLEICDQFPSQDNGSFTRADLYLTSLPASYADLSLAKTVSNATPASGTAVSYTLTVTNRAGSPNSASGITVLDILPGGFTFVSASGTGSYSSGTGVWTLGTTLAPGASAAITINGTVSASSGATVTNVAEISASSIADSDSTPNNGAAGEDDFASRSFTVAGTRVAGTPPTLVCPVGTTLLDWNSQSWTSGSATGSAALAFIGTVNFSVATQGSYNAPLALTSDNTGGFGGGQLSLFQSIEYTNRTEVTTTTVTLPTAVPGVQFTVFDVDFANNDFADKLTVTGTFNGAAVTPTLTNGIANYVAGNTAIGDTGSGGTSADGNVVVTFAAPVDTIVVTYGNHSTAPADPDGQAISLYDFNFCRPTANLTVAKTSSVVSDPTNGTTNPKAIPGATMFYCVLVTNNGSGTATGVDIADTLPATTTYVPASLRSGTSCAAATTVEDDNAAGADESDPFGASIAGTAIAATAATLAPTGALAIAFTVTVN